MNSEGTLVILTPGFAASEEDSNCLPMQQSLVRTLNDLYPQLKIFVLSFQYPYCSKRYAWHKAVVYSFNGRNKGGLRRLWLRQKINQTLRHLHRTETVIGLLSFWYGECAAVGHLFSKKTAIKHLCWLLGQDARSGNKHPARYRLPPNNLIALSDFIQRQFEENYGSKPAYVVPPAVNPQHLFLSGCEKDIDLLAAGSLIPLKQYHLFIEVIAEVKKIRPTIKAVLIGDGPERETIKALIRKHALQNNVELAGHLQHLDVLYAMQRAKLFIHPSSYEGFGVVCLEALYAGANVISFVQPMRQEIDGWHVVNNSEEMVQKAAHLLQTTTSYNARLVYNMADTAEKMMGLFEKG